MPQDPGQVSKLFLDWRRICAFAYKNEEISIWILWLVRALKKLICIFKMMMHRKREKHSYLYVQYLFRGEDQMTKDSRGNVPS